MPQRGIPTIYSLAYLYNFGRLEIELLAGRYHEEIESAICHSSLLDLSWENALHYWAAKTTGKIIQFTHTHTHTYVCVCVCKLHYIYIYTHEKMIKEIGIFILCYLSFYCSQQNSTYDHSQENKIFKNECDKDKINNLIYFRVFTQECCEQFWTSLGDNTPQSSSCMATYLPSRKLSKLDEPDMQDTAREAGTSFISDVFLWTPAHGRAKAGRPARTYIQQLCKDTGYSPEDPPEAMNDREEWWERIRDIRAGGMTRRWWIRFISIS